MIVLSSPGEIAFKVFNLPIYYYGIIVSVAAIVGFYCSLFIAKKYYKERLSKIFYKDALDKMKELKSKGYKIFQVDILI